jgi:hypothetical protein
MNPPYKLVDEATGETIFSGMDTDPGEYIEVYSGPSSGDPDTRISDGAYQRPGGTPPDPIPPDPNPSPGGSMDYPSNESQLRDALNTYLNEQRIGMLDPRTAIDLSSTISLAAPNSGNPWGVYGNGAKLHWRGQRDQDMLVITGTQGANCRGLTLTGLYIDGGDVASLSGAGARRGLVLSAPLGDSGPIYQFTLRDIYAVGAVNGIVLEGGVYEGVVDNAQIENCSGDGMLMQHLNLGAPGQGVVSNIHVNHLNASRNLGAGLKTVYSVSLVGGSFVLNGRGIDAPDGLRSIAFANFENTAGPSQCGIDLGSNGYGSVVFACECSSDGATCCRKWDGSQWVNVGAPMLYLMNQPGGVEQQYNHCSYYGGGGNPMRVVK